jgi:hypothetical protein
LGKGNQSLAIEPCQPGANEADQRRHFQQLSDKPVNQAFDLSFGHSAVTTQDGQVISAKKINGNINVD